MRAGAGADGPPGRATPAGPRQGTAGGGRGPHRSHSGPDPGKRDPRGWPCVNPGVESEVRGSQGKGELCGRINMEDLTGALRARAGMACGVHACMLAPRPIILSTRPSTHINPQEEAHCSREHQRWSVTPRLHTAFSYNQNTMHTATPRPLNQNP